MPLLIIFVLRTPPEWNYSYHFLVQLYIKFIFLLNTPFLVFSQFSLQFVSFVMCCVRPAPVHPSLSLFLSVSCFTDLYHSVATSLSLCVYNDSALILDCGLLTLQYIVICFSVKKCTSFLNVAKHMKSSSFGFLENYEFTFYLLLFSITTDTV